MKIRERLAALRQAAPNRAASGQLYRTVSETRRVFRSIRVYALLVSTRNNFTIHESVFKKDQGKNPDAWAVWLTKHSSDIYQASILPGLHLRDSSQSWSVKQFIGWRGETMPRKPRKAKRKAKRKSRVKRKSRHSKMARGRHKAKR